MKENLEQWEKSHEIPCCINDIEWEERRLSSLSPYYLEKRAPVQVLELKKLNLSEKFSENAKDYIDIKKEEEKEEKKEEEKRRKKKGRNLKLIPVATSKIKFKLTISLFVVNPQFKIKFALILIARQCFVWHTCWTTLLGSNIYHISNPYSKPILFQDSNKK